MRKIVLTLLFIFVSVLLLSVCTARRGSFGQSIFSDPIRVLVTNHNWASATVLVYCGEKRAARLNRIPTGQTKSKLARTTPCQSITFVIDFLGHSNRYRTDRIMVNPGDCIRLILENQLSLTSWHPCPRAE